MRNFVIVVFIFVCVLFFTTICDAKRALVLSGGAAKGAFQVGALKRLCERDRNFNYDMIVGTSIGALNAAAIAQFRKSQFCSSAIPTAERFWRDIKSRNHIFESWSWLSVGECLNPLNFLSLANGWYKKGGMCTTKPGKDRFSRAVSGSNIANSDIQLFISASALDDITKPHWFTNRSPRIVDYSFASGSLSPMFAPEKINGIHYIDGGFFTNVPILKAIEEGATVIDVFLLQTLGNEADVEKLRKAVKDKKVGPYAAQHFIDIVNKHLTLNAEIRVACLQHSKVTIRAIIPRSVVGETLGFSESEISKMINDGYNHVNQFGLEDLCASAAHLKGPVGDELREMSKMRTQMSAEDTVKKSNVYINIGAGIGGITIGALLVVAFLTKRKKMDPNAFFEIPQKQ